MSTSVITFVVCVLSLFIYILLNTSSSSIQLIFHPDRFHGDSVKNGIFFEGWYYKMVFNEYNHTFIVIPGVFMNDNNRHSFIMVAYKNVSHYYRFPFETFSSSSSSEEFHIEIDKKKNVFSYDKLLLDLQATSDDDATENFQMNFTLRSHVVIPDLSWIMPGTMGPYSWIPTMQCYHHVLSMKHDVYGSIKIDNNKSLNVTGVGYIEKDWGHSFPSIWIWGQTNQWENQSATVSASLFFSLALIPWYFKLEFAGFLVVFEYNGIFYRFNTYLQSIIKNLHVNQIESQVSFDVYDVLFQHKLHISTYCNDTEIVQGAILYGPRNGRMEKFVNEILVHNLHFHVRLSKLIKSQTQDDDNEEIVFEGYGKNVAFEINGDVKYLSEKFHQTYDHIYPWNFSFMRSLIEYCQFILSKIY